MITVEQLIEKAEELCVTEDPNELGIAWAFFTDMLDLFCLYYFNPGEPETECCFCGRNCALPGVYGIDAYTSEEIETGVTLDSNAYWARVWATRALDILEGDGEDACCLERDKLWATLEL